MKFEDDIQLKKRLHKRDRARPKTEAEKDFLAKKKLRQHEALQHHLQAQQKFKDPPTQQTTP